MADAAVVESPVVVESPAAVPTGWKPYFWRKGQVWRLIIAAPLPVEQPDTGVFLADHPGAIEVLALIDTGTSHTFAVRSLFDRLQLTPTGDRITSHWGSEVAIQDNFRVDLALPYTSSDGHALLLRQHPVSDAPDGALGTDAHVCPVVIGNDVLRFCRFTIDGPKGLFRLEQSET